VAAAIDFYFDFGSPYGYFASHRIDALAARHGRTVDWRPYLLGAAFKLNGRKPLAEQPLVRDYAVHDMKRTARAMDIPFVLPAIFPISGVPACRAFYWIRDTRPAVAAPFARAVLAAYFAEDRDIADPQVVADIGAGFGLELEALRAALQDPAVKDRLRRETDAAIERGVFGSPFVIVDGEPFWGNDRLDQVERWLESGGW